MFTGNRLPFLLGLLVAVFCLSLYIRHLVGEWGPVLRSQAILAPTVSLPIAQDFPLHYTASFLAQTGEPGAVYDYSRFSSVEEELTGWGPHPWPYPPTALLLDLPLALAPYFVSLAVWLAVTMGFYLLVLYRLAPHPITILGTLAFFGTFENFYFGQNGFVNAALLGGGLLYLASSPFLGGMLLGLLSYKPHIFVLIPLALILGRRWRALLGALVSASALVIASAVVFGPDIWQSFLDNIAGTMTNLQTESRWFYKMPSVFAAARLAGCSAAVAWGLHSLGMLGALILLAWTWTGQTSPADRAASLVIAILLFSPHIWYYDLTLLAIPLAMFWWQGYTSGWFPGEQVLLILSWSLPMVNFVLAVGWKWSHGPLYLAFPLAILVWRTSGIFCRHQNFQPTHYACRTAGTDSTD
jgi:hypothetical protein